MHSKYKTGAFLIFVIVFLSAVSYTVSQTEDECVCVMYYLCDRTNRTVITDGAGVFDERIGEDCSCNPSCPDLYKCCRLQNNATTTSPETTSSSGTTARCGVRNFDGVGFKIGSSEDTQFGEFPWMVGVLDDSGSYRCGGSLIHPSVVLTAAHCVVRKKNYIVRAGEWDSSNTKENLKHQDLSVSNIKIHENYYPPIQHNDIALLFLNRSFTLGSHINTVCLPPSNVDFDSENRCYVTGWGKNRFGVGGQYPAIMKKTDLPLVESGVCQSNLRITKLGQNFKLDRSSLCAGGEQDKDACIGDGGGPLVCPVRGEEGRYHQIGIVSWGVECNKENVPGIYSNVPFLRKWVDQQMNDRNLDTNYYQLS